MKGRKFTERNDPAKPVSGSGTEETVDSLDKLRVSFEKARGHKPPGRFIFRGQPANWKLKTSLELACEQIEESPDTSPLTRALEREAFFLREFKRRAHHYLPDLPGPDHTLEWFSLMRHHGAPTRLIDCSYSMYVATYFAIQHSQREKCSGEGKDAGAAVWMFDAEWFSETTKRLFNNADRTMLEEEITFESEPAVAKVLRARQIPYVFPVNSFRLNERLTIQRGLFLWPGDVSQPFQNSLDAMSWEKGANVTKFIIPRESFRKISEDLHGLNISEATLFPGLDGFARSLVTARRFLEVQRPFLPRNRSLRSSRVRARHEERRRR